jgi:cytidylate kinase
MAIITISRGSYCGGRELAELVSSELNYKCISREDLLSRASAYNLPKEQMDKAKIRSPNFLDWILGRKALYISVMRTILLEEEDSGNIVYHGMAGHLLLKDYPAILKVKVLAPLKYRIEYVMRTHGMSQEQAIGYIRNMDRERARWTRHLYGVDWNDPFLYDLVINLQQMDLSAAVSIICQSARNSCFQSNSVNQITGNLK